MRIPQQKTFYFRLPGLVHLDNAQTGRGSQEPPLTPAPEGPDSQTKAEQQVLTISRVTT